MSPPPDARNLALLVPRPQRLQPLPGALVLPRRVTLGAAPEMLEMPAVEWLERALEARGHTLERDAGGSGHGPGRPPGALRVGVLAPGRLPARGAIREGYALDVDASGVTLSVTSGAGFQNALATLTQLVALADGAPGEVALPCLRIEDWPDFAQRGFMLDISRDKVPTLATLRALADALARWKLNQLQLYMEHTFAYPGHDIVWKDASPLSALDVRELDLWCAARHIELVPNQNSFGHMHRWLVHEPYRRLAECPDGFDHPWNWTKEPYGLCATDPGTLRLLEGLYDALLPHFSSRQFNVGLDETIDLGAGRSRQACEARGTERVYLEFLQAVSERVRARGKVMQFWGDIIVKRPDLMPELPRDAIALEWGYEADHPFAEHLALFRQAGLDFYVCPGTSSWNSIAGRTDNAIGNLARAAREGKAAGASGLLITDWGDHGHLQPLSVSWLGLLAGAGFAWNASAAERPEAIDLPRLLDRHAFGDSAGVLGRAAYDLGNAYREAGSLRPNASVLFWSLIKPERLFSPPGVTRESLEHTLDYIERAGSALARARPGTGTLAAPLASAAPGAPGAVEELAWARDLLSFACRLGIAHSSLSDGQSLAALPSARRTELRRELGELLERHRTLWLARNREGGLVDSARRLERIAEALGGAATPRAGR
jgi:hexosaminidase